MKIASRYRYILIDIRMPLNHVSNPLYEALFFKGISSTLQVRLELL
ncbi:MAG: hypothetical protein A4E57_04230 [Syntrophorhabdaceae bacterium PtaU1.Bin034]|nr:MAG: hypothetical protein A4E57_04230 [Syntrophorhabdaceae bacterium PtaU1.Bin034]